MRIRPKASPKEGRKAEKDFELVPFDPVKSERKVRTGWRLSPKEKVEFATFLKNNKDVFAWSLSDMYGIDTRIISHRLYVNPANKPVTQKRRNFALERVAIIETNSS
ncbi:PREDICTED: Asp_protease_2 domain-containing [Prunus dulcis]|uniref:PREDICTED: Asp_protease_2 domain-containing n=1 Tax=Prunus dulcis TaxID=3755 RepID=A0A5E4FIP5_PRUDU|nr:PREDICTED: Asp_protease_2 domain-containing [Prunus dulcis]